MSARSLPSFSLRTKLLALAAGLVAVPGGIYGAITVAHSRATIARLVGRQLVAEARNGADRLSTALRSEQARLASFAGQDVMREVRTGDFDKRISSFLASVKRGCAACVDLLVLDREDRVVAASAPSWIGATVAASGGAAKPIEGPLPGAAGSPILRLAAPVPDPEVPETRLGRLVALLDWERATEVIARVRSNLVSVGLDADVLIVDAGGTVIGGAAAPGRAWRRGDSLEPAALVEGAPPAARIDSRAGVLLGEALLAGDLPRWRIVVAQPLGEALAPVRRAATLLGAALAATLLAAMAIALLAARRTTRPLAELTAAADSVRRGGGPAPTVRLRSRDEIGTLTAAFNRMSVDLRRAERELVDAAKFAFVGELAAGVAHEVRTPLGVLRSSAQLLERSLEAKDDDARELLHLVRAEVDRIERIVSELLELGRPRELKRESTPLGPILSRAADFVEVQAREKGVGVRRRAIESDPEVLCDPELVYQVALNLLVNAVQVLPGGGSVEIGLVAPRDGQAGFEVVDDGPGMTEEVRARIFEPFFTRRDGGAGLGLTFVQRVVHEHRGRVAVESAPGRGTRFRIELPLGGGAA
ncbi:MAG: HAMP domain-containing protein [Deltaproteobacteria bacterium]|nr:HAMP domain-containing protein [Deltaproteobacteria bacterium]